MKKRYPMKPLYRVAKALLAVCYWLNGARVFGRENVPEDQAFLNVSNHISHGDPPAISWAFPRQITYIAKEAFARNWFTRNLFRGLGAVFLDRGGSDMTAMRTAINVLKNGQVVAIYPEGKRHLDQQMGEFKNGAAFIATRCRVRVLPVAVINTGDFFRFWKRNILVRFGETLPVCTEPRITGEVLEEQTALYRQKIEELLAESLELLTKEGRPMRKPPKA